MRFHNACRECGELCASCLDFFLKFRAAVTYTPDGVAGNRFCLLCFEEKKRLVRDPFLHEEGLTNLGFYLRRCANHRPPYAFTEPGIAARADLAANLPVGYGLRTYPNLDLNLTLYTLEPYAAEWELTTIFATGGGGEAYLAPKKGIDLLPGQLRCLCNKCEKLRINQPTLPLPPEEQTFRGETIDRLNREALETFAETMARARELAATTTTPTAATTTFGFTEPNGWVEMPPQLNTTVVHDFPIPPIGQELDLFAPPITIPRRRPGR